MADSAHEDGPNSGSLLPDEAAEQLAFLETFFRNAPVSIGFIDRNFRYVLVNKALAETDGLAGEEMVGRTVADVLPGLWPTLEPYYRRALGGETILQIPVTGLVPRLGSLVRHWLASYYPVTLRGEVVGIGVIVSDITAIRAAKEALSVRKHLYAMLSRTNRAVSQSRSRAALFDEVCATAVETGHFRFAWVGVPDGDRLTVVASAGIDGGYMSTLVISLNPDDPRSQGPTGRAFRLGESVVVNDFQASAMTAPWHAKAAASGFAASAAFPLRERGHVVAVLTLYANTPGFFTDDLVTTLSELTPSISFALDAFVHEEDRLRDEAELRLRDRAIRAVSQGIVIADATVPDNPIVFVSQGFERLTGYTASEVIGRNCRFLQGPDTDRGALQELRAALTDGRPVQVEFANYRRDRTVFWNSLAISPVRDGAGRLTHFVGVQTDVTARRQLEAQYRQSQKMEAVGQLAGGIAHDFNNLLTVINGSVEMLLADVQAGHPAEELLAEIQHAGERASALTHQLLAFSRQQVLEPRPLDVNSVLADTEKMLRRLLGEDVTLLTSRDPALCPVVADYGQMVQLLVNLSVNARDAMPTGGRLTISTEHVATGAGRLGAGGVKEDGPIVRLTVTDTGVGMDEGTRLRIFEPFFTTKRAGHGTGLGLVTVSTVVAECGGRVEVRSAVGRGTSFVVELPVTCEVPADVERSAPAHTEPRRAATVLLVEDDAAVRLLTRRILVGAGFQVIEATDGDSALERAGRHDGVIDVLLSDVVMPSLGGRELAERVIQARPGCKVLFISGYTDDALLRYGVQAAEYAFLHKPFTRAALLAKLDELLRV